MVGSQVETTTTGWAARDSSGILSPYTYTLRSTGPEDVLLKVLCCGICYSDVDMVKDNHGITKYPIVPGHEVVGEVAEVGSEVRKFARGDRVGVGFVIGSCRNCCSCNSGNDHYCSQRIPIFSAIDGHGNLTQGGLSASMVVDQRYLVKVPKGMAPEQAAPLLCAGITVFSPLIKFGLQKTGLKGGILGLGGLGHLGLKIAKAMGHHVTVISSSDEKEEEALNYLGADEYLVSWDTTRLQGAADSLDYIVDTLPVFHPLEPYISLLKVDGKLILLGTVKATKPLQIPSILISVKRISMMGSFIGSVREMEELIEFFGEKGLTSQIELVTMENVNKAFKRLESNDVRYRFVVDVAGSNLYPEDAKP